MELSQDVLAEWKSSFELLVVLVVVIASILALICHVDVISYICL